jgi:hypothetical protein
LPGTAARGDRRRAMRLRPIPSVSPYHEAKKSISSLSDPLVFKGPQRFTLSIMCRQKRSKGAAHHTKARKTAKLPQKKAAEAPHNTKKRALCQDIPILLTNVAKMNKKP